MRACDVDPGALRENLLGYLDNELKGIVIENGGDAKPTPAFQRVAQRAELHAQRLGRLAVTGANALVGIFPETRSPAARLLAEQGMSLGRTADIIAQEFGWHPRR
jgi:ATP-dependent Lon protease